MAQTATRKRISLADVKLGPSTEELRALQFDEAQAECLGWMRFSAAGLSALADNDFSLLSKRDGGAFAVAAAAQSPKTADAILVPQDMDEAIEAGNELVFQLRAFDNEGNNLAHDARFSLSAITGGNTSKLVQLGTFAYCPEQEQFLGVATGRMAEAYSTMALVPEEFEHEGQIVQALTIYVTQA